MQSRFCLLGDWFSHFPHPYELGKIVPGAHMTWPAANRRVEAGQGSAVAGCRGGGLVERVDASDDHRLGDLVGRSLHVRLLLAARLHCTIRYH